MATDIFETFNARTENRAGDPAETTFCLTSFFGGEERGRCLQISVGNEFVEFTKQEIVDIIKVLDEWVKGR